MQRQSNNSSHLEIRGIATSQGLRIQQLCIIDAYGGNKLMPVCCASTVCKETYDSPFQKVTRGISMLSSVTMQIFSDHKSSSRKSQVYL